MIREDVGEINSDLEQIRLNKRYFEKIERELKRDFAYCFLVFIM
jgi:formate/nitrite transporter FocA (FNT family)